MPTSERLSPRTKSAEGAGGAEVADGEAPDADCEHCDNCRDRPAERLVSPPAEPPAEDERDGGIQTWHRALFLGGASPALPIAEHILLVGTWGFLFFGVSLVLFGTVRANGEVVWPLIILFISMYPVRLGFAFGAREWLGLDALWLSFPAGMVATTIMAVVLYRNGGWRRKHMAPADCPDDMECREQAEAVREPGGALNPAG